MVVEITDAAEAILRDLVGFQGLDFSNVRVRATRHPIDGWRLELTNDPWPSETTRDVRGIRVSTDKASAPVTMVIDHVESKYAIGFVVTTT